MTKQDLEPQEEEGVKSVLCEIIGATDLRHPTNDDRNMHPFVIATLHAQHQEKLMLTRTKRRKNTCNPIWCVEHRCLFLLNVTDAMLKDQRNCTLQLDVRDKDCVINDPLHCTMLGSAKLSLSNILQCCLLSPEERIELELKNEICLTNLESIENCENDHGCDDEDCKVSTPSSMISIRFRFATPNDRQFMQETENINDTMSRSKINNFWRKIAKSVHGGKKRMVDKGGMSEQKLVTDIGQQELGVNGIMNVMNGAYGWKTSRGSDGVLRERVQPYPDPSRQSETKYLSHAEMKNEIYKPSTNWTESGGETEETLGKVYLEIIECEDLPNMDTGEALGNKTDAFVCAIFEESLVQTDVIDDRLSPMWMPWTKRAFCFNIRHPFSQLFISVNDFDLGPSSHDGIGRISINLNHYESNVVYTLKYKLHPAANVLAREVSEFEKNKLSLKLKEI